MIRILRLIGPSAMISGRVFDRLFARNLCPEMSLEAVDLAQWLNFIFENGPIRPHDKAILRTFRSATRDYDFLCPNFVAIPSTPLLLYLRNCSRAPIRLLLIAHAPGAYALEWALLRPLLLKGDVIIAPSTSAQDAINFLSSELAAYTRVVPHPMRPLPYFHMRRRRDITSLTRMHPSKLLHRQIEAMAILSARGIRNCRMRIAGPIHEPGGQHTTPYVRSLLAKISRLRLEDSVELVGELQDAREKGRFLAGARLLVNLSVTIEESFGKAIVEALGAGAPVLATHWNGFPETVGAGGTCVAVEVTPLGMDVSAQRIANAVEKLLDSLPTHEVCQREALRFHPQQVGSLYRRVLEAAIQASVTDSTDRARIPDDGLSAAPTQGVLAYTAPLPQYSWWELFQIHVRDVASLRASLASQAQRDTTEADDLRSLLIAGIRAPLGRRLAGVSLDGIDHPVGTGYSSKCGGEFWGKIGEGALGPATLSSRLGCLSLLAHARRLRALRRGVEAMRADGLRSWGIEHFEIEALGLEGQYERAFQMSTARRDRLYWGDLAADRLHQLAILCRGWGRPELALPYLQEWVKRFPDSPESGSIYLDLCCNLMALCGDWSEEFSRALESARRLLGESADLTTIEQSMRRVEALKRDLQRTAVAEKTGRIASLSPVGRSTFLVNAARGKFVLKQMQLDRDPDRYFDVLRRLAQIPDRFCPRQIAALPAGACWYALFEWVEGRCLSSFDVDDSDWRSAVNLLRRLVKCDVVPEWCLESIWLDRLQHHISDEPAAAFMLDRLRRAMPRGERTLAHGDFALQNFVYRPRSRMLLVDWEEIGSAPPGFDAGWMLAHARIGVGVRSYEEMLPVLVGAGFSRPNLGWFEALGLLRLLFRARSLASDDRPYHRVRVAVERAVYECAEAVA